MFAKLSENTHRAMICDHTIYIIYDYVFYTGEHKDKFRWKKYTWYSLSNHTMCFYMYWQLLEYRSLCRLEIPLHWRNIGNDSISNHQPCDCLLNCLFRRRSKKISKLRVTGFCAGNSPETGEFPAQMASNAETVSIWWRHHDLPRPM